MKVNRCKAFSMKLLIPKASWIANPNMLELIPLITMGNMYKISLGHAGSP